ncbi:hypothetical protein AB0O52_11455 [Arthrobacter sp. NPDC080073]|uniref:hypothetical protein n=1 Tax=Arthrobacter sp. NPDC080073 TaxID=3155919 RepID=UPI00341EAB43
MSYAPDPNVPDAASAPVEPPMAYLDRIEAQSLLRNEICPECGHRPKPIAAYDGQGRAAELHTPECPMNLQYE